LFSLVNGTFWSQFIQKKSGSMLLGEMWETDKTLLIKMESEFHQGLLCPCTYTASKHCWLIVDCIYGHIYTPGV